MGLLDAVIGSLMDGDGRSTSPIGGILMNMLAGGGDAGSQGTNGASGMAGGLGGVLSSFQQAGLGNIAQSWIGNGPNQPVSPGQLQNVFGHDQVRNMARKAGMAPGEFLTQLSRHLPNAVNGMTLHAHNPDKFAVPV